MRPFIVLNLVLSIAAVFTSGAVWYQSAQVRLEARTIVLECEAALKENMAALEAQHKDLQTMVQIAGADALSARNAATSEDPRLATFRDRIRALEENAMTAPDAGADWKGLRDSLAITDRHLDDVRRRLGALETAQ